MMQLYKLHALRCAAVVTPLIVITPCSVTAVPLKDKGYNTIYTQLQGSHLAAVLHCGVQMFMHV